MRRLAALVTALALVVGAVWLRSRLTDADGSGASPSSADEYRLLCVTELRSVCEPLEGREGISVLTESAGDTFERLSEGSEPGFDGWLTPRVWVDAVLADPDADLDPTLPGLATSPLVLAVRRDSLGKVQGACAPLTWKCLGGQAGSVSLGADRPGDGAWGLPVLGQRAAGFFERAGISVSDFQDQAFRDWLGSIKRSAREEGAPDFPATSRLVLPGFFDAVGTVAATVPVRPDVAVEVIEPAASVELVLAAPARHASAGTERLELIRRALADRGWGSDPAAGSLPSGGTLVALRDLWEKV